VVKRPFAVFVTETHVTGWLAMVWASLALAPLKRLFIEFPFVAAKAFPSPRFRAAGTRAVHQKYRLSPLCARD